ncbi:hypothetical protein OQA88_2218 [Cercophora sp. LCS_1]
MRDTSSLRPTSLAAFASLFLLASASTVPRPECVHTRSEELAARASCGDEGSLNYCFSHLVSLNPNTADEQLASELERCFQNAGCTDAESQIEALWTLQRCDSEPTDLRRRRPEAAMPIAREASPLGGGITIVAARQATTNPPAGTQPAPTTAAPANRSPSPCFTETTVDITSCPTQSTGPDAGKKLPCFPTQIPSQVCAAGLICQMDNQGNPSCMFKESGLGLAGTIIAIFFASAVAISVVSVCFFCCRERRVQNRLIRAAEAAKIAQEAKTQAAVNAKKVGNDGPGLDRQPLMSQPASEDLPPLPQMQSQYGSGGYQGGAAQDYNSGGHGQNPFVDSGHPLR